MSDDLDGKTQDCCQCRIPMVAVSISMDWCERCGTIWQYHLKAFRSPAGSSPVAETPAPQPQTTVRPYVQKPRVESKPFVIPSGKYKGMTLDQLADDTLERVWAGFHGTKLHKVAAVLRSELDRRQGLYRGSLYGGH
jgi:hypothetical protein